MQGTESEQDSRESDPHSFVNHYANVNNTFRQSWKRQKPIQAVTPSKSNSGAVASMAAVASAAGGGGTTSSSAAGNGGARGYSSFTESSDQDGNSAVVSLNGTQLVLNNKARSRAPLPGFSSFV